MDSIETFNSTYTKEFQIEIEQIQYWFTTLKAMNSQVTLIKEATDQEIKSQEVFAKIILNSVKNYLNEIIIYKDEPTNLIKNTLILVQFLETIGIIFLEELPVINTNTQKLSNTVINEINCLLNNIRENSNTMMGQILDQKKKSKSLEVKYDKLKGELDEANLKKKKIEADPKTIYNVVIKEKAEQNILSLIKRMEELLPIIHECSKELDNKKELFNKFMKETFELVITSLFKNSILVLKATFKIIQEKLEKLGKLRNIANEYRNKFMETDLNLNDYSEKKFAESKNIFFECIDSITISDNLLDITLVKVIDDLQSYATNFFNCMRMRKRLLQPFAKLILEISKAEEAVGIEYNKIYNLISINMQNFTMLGQLGMNGWDLFKSGYDQNRKFHDLLNKFLENNIFKAVISNVKETKSDYTEFYENFKYNTKDFSTYKSCILKFQKSREKFLVGIKSIRSQINKENGAVVSKLETKLKNLQDEENSLRQSYEEIGKKVKSSLRNSMENLYKQTKSIRNKENTRLVSLIESIKSIIKNYEKSYNQNLEIFTNLMEVSAHSDIYIELRQVFEKYFMKFNINNYDVFFDKIFKKILTNFNLNEGESIKEGKNLITNYLNIMSLTRLNKLKETPSENVIINTSSNMNNFISNVNIHNFNTNNHLSKNLVQFNSNSSENCFSSVNLNRKPTENQWNEFELKKSSDKNEDFERNTNTLQINLAEDNKITSNNNKMTYQSKINRISIHDKDFQMKNLTFMNNENKSVNIEIEDELKHNFDSGSLRCNNNNTQGILNINPSLSKFNRNDNYPTVNTQAQIDVNSFKSEEINLNHKPDLYFFSEANGNFPNSPNNANDAYNKAIEPEGYPSSSCSGDEEKIDFINPSNFRFLDIKNPYNNIKENDLKDYMDKIKAFMADPNSSCNPEENISELDKLLKLEIGEKVIDKFSCAFSEKILLQGKLYITNKKLVFYSWFNSKNLLFGVTKLIIPIQEIIKIEKKKVLKIIDNSIKITTNKSELFFTSFVKRDACFNAINEYWSVIKEEEEKRIINIQNEEEGANYNCVENENVDEINRPGNIMMTSKDKLSSKAMITSKILKKIDFFNRLDKIHKERLSEFESVTWDNSNLHAVFKPENIFKKIYFKDEQLGNCPIPLIFNSIFNNESICDEMEMNKTFWLSLYESRKDYDIIYEEIPSSDPSASKLPKFIQDMDYFFSLFTDIDEENLNEFLVGIAKWPKTFQFQYKFIHPIKKKMVGPDKLSLKEVYTFYFISPKLLIVEVTCYGCNFPYAENFVTFSQYRFTTNYKFNANEGTFKFNTTITLMFHIHFIKSTYFSGFIESEGYKESEESLRFNIYDKIRKVLDLQSDNFTQHYNKLNDEHLRRTINNYFSKHSEYISENKSTPGNKNLLPIFKEGQTEVDKEHEMSESENENEKNGWKIFKISEFELKSNYGAISAFSINFYKNHYLTVFILGILFFFLNLIWNYLSNGNVNIYSFSFILIILIVTIVFIVNRFINLK